MLVIINCKGEIFLIKTGKIYIYQNIFDEYCLAAKNDNNILAKYKTMEAAQEKLNSIGKMIKNNCSYNNLVFDMRLEYWK